MRRSSLALIVLALASASAHAAPLLSQTVYICDPGGCAPFGGLGPAPIDPGALASISHAVALAPGAGVSGDASRPGLYAAASAVSVGAAPPVVKILARDSDLTADGYALAHVYWEDDLTLTVSGAPFAAPILFMPSVSFSGAIDVVAGSGSFQGSSLWEFNMAVNTNPFFGQGGFCLTGSSPGPGSCTPPGGGFGSASAGVLVANGVPFNMQAQVFAEVDGLNTTALADLASTVEWLGVEVFDSGSPVTSFTLESVSGIDWTQASVPEPGLATLLAVGALLLLARGRGEPVVQKSRATRPG